MNTKIEKKKKEEEREREGENILDQVKGTRFAAKIRYTTCAYVYNQRLQQVIKTG